jgi:MFS family permease/molybdenum-dependent DNA-binding transcriptional regulator ModE
MGPHVRIDPRRLLDLLAVARHGSFSAAAAALNVSQPGLSRSIALLEREVGAKVLERGRQGAQLNAMGVALIFHAEALEALLERAREDTRLRSLGLEGTVKLGVTPTAAGIVPRALEILVKAAPKIHVSVTEGLDSEIAEMLRRGHVDLVVSRIGGGSGYQELAEEELFRSDWGNAPSARRGFFASWINASGPVGVVAASGLIALLGFIYSREEFANWVWRVPFALSLALVLIGTYVRAQVDESALFLATQAKAEDDRTPLLTILRSWKKPVLLACLVNMVHSSFNYMSTVFVLGYAVKTLGMPQSSITSGVTVANILEMCAVPLIAGFSDKLGRRPFIILGIVVAAAWYPIFFQILLTKEPLAIMAGFVVSLGLVHALMFAPEAAFTAELFPTRVRVSGSSLGKQLGIVLGGGLAPLIGTALMGSSTSFTPVVLYFEAIACLALLGVFLAPENSRKALE